MKRFKCEVTRTDEYIIEFDENVINDEWMKGFSSYMWEATEHEELAEGIAKYRARNGEGFIEGFGRPLENGKRPIWSNKDEQLQEAINIQVISEDSDIDVEVEEI